MESKLLLSAKKPPKMQETPDSNFFKTPSKLSRGKTSLLLGLSSAKGNQASSPASFSRNSTSLVLRPHTTIPGTISSSPSRKAGKILSHSRNSSTQDLTLAKQLLDNT